MLVLAAASDGLEEAFTIRHKPRPEARDVVARLLPAVPASAIVQLPLGPVVFVPVGPGRYAVSG
jgi:hypothetical protein